RKQDAVQVAAWQFRQLAQVNIEVAPPILLQIEFSQAQPGRTEAGPVADYSLPQRLCLGVLVEAQADLSQLVLALVGAKAIDHAGEVRSCLRPQQPEHGCPGTVQVALFGPKYAFQEQQLSI